MTPLDSISHTFTSVASTAPSAVIGGTAKAGLLPPWLDPINLLNPQLGIFVVVVACLIIFAETGLLIGFFLPGDSLLFTAGLLTATGHIVIFGNPLIDIWIFAALLVICAIVGNQVGYLIGAKAGPSLFNRPNSRFFRQENIAKAHEFFERHGGKALILGRFVPIVRTFIPVVVGVAKMDRKKFFVFNVVGGLLWAGGITLLGGLLGNSIPWIKDYLDIIFIGIVLVSVLPIAIEFIRGWLKRRKEAPASE